MQLFDDLLNAFVQDVGTTRYSTWADVLDYCRRSANPVGRLVLRLSGYHDDRLDAASDAVCTALQLTNFWQDFAVDWSRGRLYVPEEIWRAHQADLASLDASRMTPQWAAALADCGSADARVVRARTTGLRRRVRTAALRAARDMARRHAHSRSPRTRGLRRLPIRPPKTRSLRRISDSVWNAVVARDTSFSYSFLVLPAAQRRAIGVVWDFCRAVDDAVDEAESPETAATAVVKWREEVGRLFGAETPQTPQAANLKPCVAMFSLSRQPFDDLVDGVEMDLRRSRYDTFDELVGYCRRVASAVGMMCIEVFGCRDSRSREYAFNLGLALQITNIIRDIKADLKQGRIYLPQEDLARFGVTEQALAAGEMTDAVRRLLAFECQRARHFYAAAAQAMPHAESRKLVAAEIMGGIYFEILQRIERRGYDVFSERVRVPKLQRATHRAADLGAVAVVGFRPDAIGADGRTEVRHYGCYT